MTYSANTLSTDPLSLSSSPASVAVLHGAGYVGGELVRLLLGHPAVELAAVTSRTFADEPVWAAHPHLRGQTDLHFTAPDALDLAGLDAVLIAAEHGQGVPAVLALLEAGFDGAIVDLSADFRFDDPADYETWFGYTHGAPALLDRFAYGLVEAGAPLPADAKYVANPGCFATGISLALWPLAQHLPAFSASVTALTGASGSGAHPKATTHFPTRDGNVRAYKIFRHQHGPEIRKVLGTHAEVAFVPASGPWTRGIWGTATVTLPAGTTEQDVAAWFDDAYGEAACVRTWAGTLPELRAVVNTPFCDLGWVVRDAHLVVGFALDNLLKGAASQAVQNLNLLLGLPDATGLLAASHVAPILS